MSDGSPADGAQVLQSLRLGWAVAESRGRLRRGPPQEDSSPLRVGHALPLGPERSWAEQTIETQTVAITLAGELGLDFDCGDLSGFTRQTGTKVSSYFAGRAEALWSARRKDDREGAARTWDQLARLVYAWDARIQDALAASSFSVASGYQLGRGLAETYWANDAAAAGASDPQSWEFLLGAGRVDAIAQLQRRLTAYFLPMTAPAIEASLRAWLEVARDGSLRSRPQTLEALHRQVRVWHDLLLTGQPPESLVERGNVLARARRVGPVLRAFLPEAAVGLVSVAMAAAAAGLFATGGGHRFAAGVLAVLGFFGVTGSGALAKAKDEAHDLFAQLRDAFQADLVKQAVTVPPARLVER